MKKSPSAPPSSTRAENLGFSFQEDLWFGDFDDETARAAAASSMAAMAGRVMGARPFPAAAQKLVQLTKSDNSNILKVVRVLEADPGLSQRVLRLVNSAGYGLRVRCTSLNHATALLGQQRLRQIATSAVLLNHFGKTSNETRRKQEHGALVASLCRYLGIHLGLPQEDLFTCGLLHDLGQLMMLDEGDDNYSELVLAHENEWDSLHISEREILGFDHAVLAAHVLASWSIPAPIPEIIALHHQPALAHQRGPQIAAMVQTLRFADHMSHLLQTTNSAEGSVRLAESESASYLGFSEMQIYSMWGDLRQLHEANLNRRMDIADIAPRTLSVPAALAPREVAITDAPIRISGTPTAATKPSPAFNEEPLGHRESELSPETEPLSDGAVLTFEQATPVADPSRLLGTQNAANEAESPSSGKGEQEEDRPSNAGAAPEVFPCAICYGPTFGARCPVCAAHVCTAHQTTGLQWCMACEHEFQRYLGQHAMAPIIKIAGGAATAVAVGSGLLFGGWQAGLGILGLCFSFFLGAYALHQGMLKSIFKKERAPRDVQPHTLGCSEVDAHNAGLPKDAQARLLEEDPATEAQRERPAGPSPSEAKAEAEAEADSCREAATEAPSPPTQQTAALTARTKEAPAFEASPVTTNSRLETADLEAMAGSEVERFSWPPSQATPHRSHRASMVPAQPQAEGPVSSSHAQPAEGPVSSSHAQPAEGPASSSHAQPHEIGTEFEPPSSEGKISTIHPESQAKLSTEDIPAVLSYLPQDADSTQIESPRPAIAPPSQPAEGSPSDAELDDDSLRDETSETLTPQPKESAPVQSVGVRSAPQCELAVPNATIQPPVIAPPRLSCTPAPGTVRIMPLVDQEALDAPAPSNDQSRQASGDE